MGRRGMARVGKMEKGLEERKGEVKEGRGRRWAGGESEKRERKRM